MADSHPAGTGGLVELLDLDDLDVDLFRGRPAETERPRVYGGQVAAQALMAAVRTVDPAYVVHSLHSYFLLSGDTAVPIIYDVERIRDGRSFATRRVVARQHGRPIYYLTASLQRPEDGVDMIALMRAGGAPDADALAKEWAALDARHLGTSLRGLPEDPAHPARARMWIRINERLSDDPVEHLAAFTFASDMSLLGATLAAHRADPATVQMASLDHTIWFHRPFRADEWWLYDQVSPSAQGGRGLAHARIFTRDGLLVATVAQEGLIRPRSAAVSRGAPGAPTSSRPGR